MFIGAYSLPVLFKQQVIPKADITIKVTGYQWYWGYEYVDHDFAFDSYMLRRDQLAEYGYAQDEYLLATDTAVVVPVNKVIVMQVTAADVIHSWTIPAFGVKQDVIPGRLAGLSGGCAGHEPGVPARGPAHLAARRGCLGGG